MKAAAPGLARPQNVLLGIALMVATTFTFAVLDGLSRHLAGRTNTVMVVTVRYWFFAAFALWLLGRRGGLGRAFASPIKGLQIVRGVLLAAEVLVTVMSFTLIGLIETHAVFAVYPLIIAALSGPFLGERAGWQRWAAILAGFVGMMVILQPGTSVFTPLSLVPLLGATIFALYGLLTRFAARADDALVSFFWTGLVGAAALTALLPWFWQPIPREDWGLMAALCAVGVGSHFLLIKAYDVAEAAVLQPFAFLQLVFVSIIGVTVFDEMLAPRVMAGASIIVAAGIFALRVSVRRDRG